MNLDFKVAKLMLLGSERDLNRVFGKDISPVLNSMGRKLYEMSPPDLGVTQTITYKFNDCIVDVYGSGGGDKAAHNYGIAGESHKVDRTVKILKESLSSISNLLEFQDSSEQEYSL